MRRSDLNLNPIRRAVAEMPTTFSTFDVIEHVEMEASSRRFAAERNYRAEVGKTLKEFCGELHIFEIRKSTSRGSVWERQNPR